MDNINFRISGYLTGDRANPRFVWGVGIPNELLHQLPEDGRRVQLAADDEKFYVRFNGKGISLSKPNPSSKMSWSGHIGVHHLNGLQPPEDTIRAKALVGHWDDEKHQLVVDNPPDFIRKAMSQSIHHAPNAEEQFPATHFSEDVQRAAEDTAFEEAAQKVESLGLKRPEKRPGVGFLIKDTTTDELVEKAQVPSDPESPTYQWFLAQVKKGQEGPFVEQVELTPELADILLRRNDGNRHIRAAKMNQYISDIVHDRWQLNGETLQVSREGDLNNGQHRCGAVMAAHKSIRTFIGFGFTRESRTTVDVGAMRTTGDHLSVQGYKNSAALAGITRFLLAYEMNEGRDTQGTNRVTTAAVNERVHRDELLSEAAHVGSSTSKMKRLAPPSVLGFAYYLMARKDRDEAKRYIEQVASGLGLERHEPAYVVRETLINRPGLSRELKIEVLLRGWNAFRQNKPMRAMRIMYELPDIV
jgi:hypothetical protein